MQIRPPLILFLAMSAALAFTQNPAAPVPSGPLAQDEAVRIALSRSRSLQEAAQDLVRAEGRLGQANSSLLPQITASAQALAFSKKNEIDLGAMMGMSGMPPFVIAREWSPSFGLQLALPLDVSGAIHAARSQAQFGEIAAKLNLDRVRNEAALGARRAWLQAQRASAMAGAARKSVSRAEVKLKDAQASHAAGWSPKFEVVSADRDLAQARQGLVAAESAEKLALIGLSMALGLDPLEPISVAEFTPSPSAEPSDLPALAQTALKSRPEILQAQAAASAARLGIRVAEAGNKPSLALGLSFQNQPNHGVFTLENVGSASLTLTVPLYDGKLTEAKAQAARADLESAAIRKAQLEDAVKSQIAEALVARSQAKAKLDLAQAGLVQAQEAYRISRTRYEQGVSQIPVVSPQLEVSAAAEGLAQAESGLLNAQIDLELAQAMLDFALGTSPLSAK